ncbi:MAG: enolase [Lachnospiraceae bacterium]|nr:enolase [Lachnospiraceae bacterium]
MLTKLEITDVHAREILDSRGNPTVEVEVSCGYGVQGRASVPSGASTGKFEAVELRDGEIRYMGLGVQNAVNNVNKKLKPALLGKNVLQQGMIDQVITDVDGTDNKGNIGANATLGVSMACARAAANYLEIPLYQYLGGILTKEMPVPMMNILNGGKHAANTVDFQEFMIMPVAAGSFQQALEMCVLVYHNLKKILQKKGLSTGVGDEGGFAPDLQDAFAVLDLIVEAIKAAGYEPDKEIKIALDVASSELYNEQDGMYHFPGETQVKRRTGERQGNAQSSAGKNDYNSIDRFHPEEIDVIPKGSYEAGVSEAGVNIAGKNVECECGCGEQGQVVVENPATGGGKSCECSKQTESIGCDCQGNGYPDADRQSRHETDIANGEHMKRESNCCCHNSEEVIRDTAEMISYYEELIEKYPIISIEDGLAEDDWEGWKEMTKRLGTKIQLVGDDLFVTNIKRLDAGIKLGVANAILVKVNQIGTLTEAFEAIDMAQKNGYKAVISHRSGETEDTIIADIAVSTNAGQIKTGAPCRTDRVAKYNQLLRIEEELGAIASYESPFQHTQGQ